MAPRSFKAHREAVAQSEQGVHLVSQKRYVVERTIIADDSTSVSMGFLPLPPQPLLIQEQSTHPAMLSEIDPEVPAIDDSEIPTPKKKTQTSRTIQEFQHAFPNILRLILGHESDSNVGTACECGNPLAKKTTRCYDCLDRGISCSACFLVSHMNQPSHWAEVWDFNQGFFVRCDSSMLNPVVASINLGHNGHPCPSRHASVLEFFLTDTNGIHKTTARFCFCHGSPNRAEQLLSARLFPATMTQPTMAFTFQVLHQFHIHHLESKESAYDFIGSLRRLSDNAFAHKVPDTSSQFRLIMRIWRLLISTKRLGQGHSIDRVLPHRREGNLIVHCPTCPDPHINMDKDWTRTPSKLRHLNQTQLTADGNHHSNKYLKNTNPDDISLCGGRSYFPKDDEYKEYISKLPDNAPEKIGPCEHLNVLNKQNRKKFKNMEITGIVSIQCSHIFIKSSVDLQLGEKFANTDYALSHALYNTSRHGLEKSKTDLDFLHHGDRLFSYDVDCGFSINVDERFISNFPEQEPFIRKTRWLIPLVHVNNHKDNCTYLYSSAYVPSAGHFQGETAEMPWVELNQLAPQTRQMNNGHRQDTIIDHHSHWNWVKTANMAATLYNEVGLAKRLFFGKFKAFKTLCDLYSDSVQEWDAMDREARKIVRSGGNRKEVQCVYRQNEKKVPSQSQIYTRLVSELTSKTNKPSMDLTVPSFVNEALLISAEQRKVIATSKEAKKGNGTTQSDVDKQRHVLRERIDQWRQLQKVLTPQIGDLVAQQAISGKTVDHPENEYLYIPSDFSEDRRVDFNLIELGETERMFREGAAYDFIQTVRITVKTLSALYARKKSQGHGQHHHTRSAKQIRHLELIRDLAIEDYSATRRAMIKLGLPADDMRLPPLALSDTFRKPTNVRRAVGDSRRTDGLLWTNTGVSGGTRHVPAPNTAPSASASAEANSGERGLSELPVGTQMRKRKHTSPARKVGVKGAKRRYVVADKDKKNEREDGWIWSFKAGQDMSDDELAQWLHDGDRVQWFRAEAEMERWREEWEIKQADFRRCIVFFERMSNVWTGLGSKSDSPGHSAYARKQSAMFAAMESHAKSLFKKAGYGHLIDLPDGKILSDYVLEERAKRKYYIPQLSPSYSEANYTYSTAPGQQPGPDPESDLDSE